jgi:hypothetical protein
MGGIVCTLLLSILLFSGCRTAQQKGIRMSVVTDRLQLNVGESENKIIFLTYEVSLADSITDVYAFRFLKSTAVDGNLKNILSKEKQPFDPTYLYVQFDENEVLKQYLKVHDPLKMQLEYPGENSSLEKRTFINKKGEITIRFLLTGKLKTISIFKVQPITLQLKKVYHASL